MMLGATLGLVGLLGAGWTAMAAEVRLLNVSYDPTRELYTQYIQLFSANYKKDTRDTVAIERSYGGLSKQARSVIDRLNADVVTLALGWDITAIERAGLINPGWEKKLPCNASPYTSTMAAAGGVLLRPGQGRHRSIMPAKREFVIHLHIDVATAVRAVTMKPQSGGARLSLDIGPPPRTSQTR